MIGVREREAVIDLTVAPVDAGRDQRRDIVRALMFAHGIDERGRRLPLAVDRAPVGLRSRRVVPTSDRLRDARVAAIYAQADLDDGQPNVRVIGRVSASSANERASRVTRRATGTVPGTRRATSGTDAGNTRAKATSSAASTGRFLTSGNAALAPQDLPFIAGQDVARSQADLRVVLRPVSMWGRRLTAMFWTFFIVGLLFLAVVMHATLAQRQGQLDDTHVQVERAERDHELLRIDVARLESPERITGIAARMGLVTPQKIRFVSPTGAMNDGSNDGSVDGTSGAAR